MSALPPKADMCSAPSHVCYGPKADILPIHSITTSARPSSDIGKVIPSCLAVLRLITSSTFVILLDRQVGWTLTLQNPTGVETNLAIFAGIDSSVAEQAA